MSYPNEYSYSKEHEWLSLDGDVATIGITDFAQDELGEVVYVDLPDIGESFDAGDEIGTIESVKAVAEVYTPIAGEIVAVNETLDETPETVNEKPHDDGWLIKMRIDPEDAKLGELMNAEAYAAFADGESD